MSRRALGSSRLLLKLYLPVTVTVLTVSLAGVLAGYLDHVVREQRAQTAGLEVRRALSSAVVEMLADARDDPVARRRLAAQLDREVHLDLSVYGVNGTLWATMGPWQLGPLTRDELERVRSGEGLAASSGDPERSTVSASRDGELVAYGLLSLPPHRGSRWRDPPPTRGIWGVLPGLGRPPYWIPPPVLWTTIALLVVLAAVSAAFARSVAGTLVQLSEIAKSFGRGDLSVRARIDRTDELGELGRAFDEMADRITSLLQAQTELMASASHELRTPLARARVALDIASEGDADLAREQLSEIAQDLGELEGLVADILIMAKLDLKRGRLEGPRQILRFDAVSARAVIDDATERFRSAHGDRQLEIDVPSDLPILRADRVLLRRAIANLLDNAAKYSDPERPVALRACERAGSVEVAVVDQGIGICKEDLEQIFTPFFRADRSRTRTTGGVGLGLALARRIVEAHGGSITVESVRDVGTTFCISIPATSSEETP